MTIHRRDLLKAGAAAAAFATIPRVASAAFAPRPGAWRNFEIVTRIEIARGAGRVQAWVPLPAVDEAEWTKPVSNTFAGNATATRLWSDPKYGAQLLHAVWADGQAGAALTVTSRIAARDRAVDLAAPGNAPPLSADERRLHTEGTELIPVDGIVRETAAKVTAGARTEIEKARAIYEWIVDNTFRDAKVRGCGVGDIAAMLRTGNLGGKCADLNALYVGLARAAGLPARDVYGLRVAPSKFGYRSLGANTDNVTRAQHCRAEVYLTGFGWVPVDPADVRKVVLEEPPGNLAVTDPLVADARKALFGAWEGNWLAYNTGHDIALPGTDGPKLGFLMYPQAETASLRLDCLDPDTFKYTITARELPAA